MPKVIFLDTISSGIYLNGLCIGVTNEFMVAMTRLILKALCCVVVLASLGGCSWLKDKPTPEAEAEKSESKPAELCAPKPGSPFAYRKKVAVLAADISNSPDASDLPGLDMAWSEALQQRLRESARFQVVNASDQHLHIGERQRDWLIDLAKRLDVQFVMAVRLNDLRVNRRQLGFGEYAIRLPNVERQIDAELIVFDGFSGVEIARSNQRASVKGPEREIVNPIKQPVLKGGFLSSALGEAMAYLLDSQVKEGQDSLACLPLMARVAKVVGRNVYIAANAASRLRPGNVLQIFRRSGVVEAHLGEAEVIRVFPESVIAVYRGEGDAPRFTQGMYARAW